MRISTMANEHIQNSCGDAVFHLLGMSSGEFYSPEVRITYFSVRHRPRQHFSDEEFQYMVRSVVLELHD